MVPQPPQSPPWDHASSWDVSSATGSTQQPGLSPTRGQRCPNSKGIGGGHSGDPLAGLGTVPCPAPTPGAPWQRGAGTGRDRQGQDTGVQQSQAQSTARGPSAGRAPGEGTLTHCRGCVGWPWLQSLHQWPELPSGAPTQTSDPGSGPGERQHARLRWGAATAPWQAGEAEGVSTAPLPAHTLEMGAVSTS